MSGTEGPTQDKRWRRFGEQVPDAGQSVMMRGDGDGEYLGETGDRRWPFRVDLVAGGLDHYSADAEWRPAPEPAGAA